MKFTKAIAKEIANRSFDDVLDCVLGRQDSDYSLGMTGEDFEQNFEEDLEEKGFVATESRLKAIAREYDKRVAKARHAIEKHYTK